MLETRQVTKTSIITVSNATILLNVGLIASGLALVLSLLTKTTAATTSIGPVPIAIALIGLMVGIPHGAVDYLTMGRDLTRGERLRGALAYIAIAAVVAAAIITWPSIAFLGVLAMTVWHFGTGDVEATRELQGLTPMTGPTRIAYALALGSAPVLLPLTSPAAVSTLVTIEPALATFFTPEAIVGTRVGVLALIVVVLLVLLQRGEVRGALELFALAVLGFVASPLVAFAVYFGFWHALRHTGRLALATYGQITPRTLARVSKGGMSSLIGFVIVVAAIVMFGDPTVALGPALWIGLAIVWGLTVPHMLLVARFDARMRASGV